MAIQLRAADPLQIFDLNGVGHPVALRGKGSARRFEGAGVRAALRLGWHKAVVGGRAVAALDAAKPVRAIPAWADLSRLGPT
jgi:hypothetical protein